MKLYTKTGDKGSTALCDGNRVDKFDERVEAYGAADELGAFTALLGDKMRDDERLKGFAGDIERISSDLMYVEALLAAGAAKVPQLPDDSIRRLEERIDSMQAALPQLQHFTLPGGCEAVSLCHVCRTVCRRAERAAVRAADRYDIRAEACTYLNRLSDYFYVLGRACGAALGVEERVWRP